jgi:hypothetical protein
MVQRRRMHPYNGLPRPRNRHRHLENLSRPIFILQNQRFHIVSLRTPKVSKPYNPRKQQPPNPLTAI